MFEPGQSSADWNRWLDCSPKTRLAGKTGGSKTASNRSCPSSAAQGVDPLSARCFHYSGAPEQQMTETDRQFTPQNGYTVLIVDDNPIQTAVRQAILRRAGYFVLAALNPVRALEMVDDKRFPAQISAVITDQVMPGMNGSKFVRELRKARPLLPVFVVSGLEEAEGEYAGLNAHFLLKPIPPDLLLSSLRNLLEATAGNAA